MMRMIRHRRLTTGARVLGGALAVGVTALAAVASPASGAPLAAQSGPVSATPASGTPALKPTTGNENVRQIVRCGTTMYAVGNFSQITWNGTTYPRNNIFSFSANAPYTMSTWNPGTNGIVDSIALSSGCSEAYIGGAFNQVDGTSANDIAEISASTGAVNQSFAHDASAEVFTLLLTPLSSPGGQHLLAGGNFKIMNGNRTSPYYISLNPTTGKNDGYLNLNISGTYVFPGAAKNATSVYNQQLSPNNNAVLAEGVFTSVGGQARQQIFMLSLGSSSGSVTGWTSPDFNQFCSTKHPFYVKAAAWGPGAATVDVGDTGKVPFNWNHQFPLTPPNLCDVVASFPATQMTSVSPTWTNYAGCDSFFSVAADQFAVYAAGHERWADNQNGCDSKGSGAIPAKGMGGFVPSTGALIKNAAGTKGLYQMSRGNADDMLLIPGVGLWIASSDRFSANQCGNATGHAGICFLPYG
jgi:hypothetical protein